MSKEAINRYVCEGCESKKCKIAVGCARAYARGAEILTMFSKTMCGTSTFRSFSSHVAKQIGVSELGARCKMKFVMLFICNMDMLKWVVLLRKMSLSCDFFSLLPLIYPYIDGVALQVKVCVGIACGWVE